MKDNNIGPALFEDVLKSKTMTGTQKLIAILTIGAMVFVGGTYGINATRTETVKDREIMVEYGFTKNMGDFESLKIKASYSKTLTTSQDVDREMDKELHDLKRFVHEKINIYAREHRTK